MGHAELFVHARGESVDGRGAADFVVELRSLFFGEGDDFLALFAIGVPVVFFGGGGLLPEGRVGDLGEAVFDDLVAFV